MKAPKKSVASEDTNNVSANAPAENVKLVTIVIDPEMTDGGIRVNGKRYVGKVEVSQDQADDLLRIQEEYYETKKKLNNPRQFVRTKSDIVKFKRFCVDPAEHEALRHNPTFQKYGLLDPRDYEYLTPTAKEYFKRERFALYAY